MKFRHCVLVHSSQSHFTRMPSLNQANVNVPGPDYSGVKLKGAKFYHANLKNVNFDEKIREIEIKS